MPNITPPEVNDSPPVENEAESFARKYPWVTSILGNSFAMPRQSSLEPPQQEKGDRLLNPKLIRVGKELVVDPIKHKKEFLEQHMYRPGVEYHPQENLDIAMGVVGGGYPGGLPKGAVGAGQIKAFHGSPHKFEKFTTKAMGTGEGSQAFGWGLYFTDKKDIAKTIEDVK